MLGYIPSPPSNGISLGPLRLHMYGLLIVAGVFAAVWLADRRWRSRGGEPGTFAAIAIWGVPGGLIGARIYHIVTDYELYTHHPIGALEIWQGGLGIWGGIAGGTLAAWFYVRRHDLDFPAIMDAVAPALPLAQAIGRWGNYFNQELFGRPTNLPWGVKIAVANRPAAYINNVAFHPTFLYESLWDLAVVLLVLYIEKHVRLRKGYLFGVYVALYTFGRFFTEYMRIDFAHKILGLRINDWVSVIIFVVATAIVLRKGLPGRAAAPPVTASGREGEVDDPALQRAPIGVAAMAGGGDTLEEGSLGLASEVEPDAGSSSEVESFGAKVATAAPKEAETAVAEPGPAAVAAEAPGDPRADAPESAPEAAEPEVMAAAGTNREDPTEPASDQEAAAPPAPAAAESVAPEPEKTEPAAGDASLAEAVEADSATAEPAMVEAPVANTVNAAPGADEPAGTAAIVVEPPHERPPH